MKLFLSLTFVALLIPCLSSCFAESLLLKDPIKVSVEHGNPSYSFSLGSGLAYSPDKTLYAVTDNGPKGNKQCQSSSKCAGDYYADKDFRPSFVELNSDTDKIDIVRVVPLSKEKNGKAIFSSGVRGGCKKTTSSYRIDPEAIAIGTNDTLWIAEEYGPSLLHINKEGRLLKKYDAKSSFSHALEKAYDGRGIEGMGTAEDGSLWFALQSVVDLKKSNPKNVKFIRIYRFDPKTEDFEIFGYSISDIKKKQRAEVKLAALEVLSADKILVLERVTISGKDRYSLVVLTSRKVKPFPSKKIASLERLEKSFDNHLLIETRRIALGFKEETQKLEGLAYNPLEEELFISVDTDFGISSKSPCGEKRVSNPIYRVQIRF